MMNLEYGKLSIVLETWDAARFGSAKKEDQKNFDEDFGMVVLSKLFELQPRSKKVFGFDKSDAEGQEHAHVHAKAFAGLFDSIFQLLGPDEEFIQDILRQVGQRHKAMNVNPAWFPFMGQALIYALEDFLGRPLTDVERHAWEEIFEKISNQIIKTMLA